MSESNEERSREEQREPGFKRALIGKLIAVGIFVALGSVAVAYSMNACKKCEEDTHLVSHDEDEKLAAEENPVSNKLQLQPVSSKGSSLTPKTATASNKKPPIITPRPDRFASLAKTNPATPAGANGNSFGGIKQPANRITAQRPATGLPAPKSFVPPQSGLNGQDGNSFGAGAKIQNNLSQMPRTLQAQPADALANRFKQPKEQPGNFVSNTIQNAKQTTQNLGEKTGDTLRKLGNRAGDLKKNLLAPPPGRTQNRAGVIIPAANGSNTRENTPVSSFDTSKDLKPFNSNPTTTPAAALRGNSLPVVKPLTGSQNPGNNLPPIRPAPVGAQPPANSRTSQPLRNRPISTTPVTQIAASSLLTRSTPGDRKLEGMQSPSVTIEKIAPSEIQLNQPADFQLVIKNVGRIVANNVRVFDQIPAGTELIQAVPQPSRGAGNQISWDLDTLEPGQEKRIKIQLRPTQPGEIGSVAQVAFAAQASMRTKVTKPVLTLRHKADPRVLIGDPVILDIDVKNEGDGAAKDVVIQEDLPEGLEFSEGFRELEYAIGTLGPGQSKNVRLELKAAKIGKYRNMLIAHAGGGLQSQHAVDIEVIAPKLVASGDGPTRRFLNREATHTFAVRNSGTANATNVELVCRLPNGLKFIDANNRGQYDENTHSIYWSLAELNSGLTANVNVTTTPTEPGNQDLKFEAAADLGQSADAICKLAVEHLVDIFFDIDDLVDPIEIGSDTAYKLTIVNQGTKTATNVQLSVEFPRGIQPTSVEGNITNEIRGQQIAFSPITSMNPGDEIEVTIRGKGITAGDHKVSVNLITDGREVNVSKQESTRVYNDR